MIGTLALIGIQVGLILLGRLLAPRVPRQRPAKFEVPVAEAGRPYPVLFGTGILTFNTMYVRDRLGNQSDDTSYTKYYAKMAGALSWGPLDEILDILVDDKAISLVPPDINERDSDDDNGALLPIDPKPPFIWPDGSDDPAVFNINAQTWFGGVRQEGGVQGEIRIYRGSQDQEIDPLTEYVLGDMASRYPHLAYICLGVSPEVDSSNDLHNFYFGVSPNPKSFGILAARFPNSLFGSSYRKVGGIGANAVEVIYECCTNDVWGRGWPASRFDTDQLEGVAAQIQIERKGISHVLDEFRDVSDFIDDILSHIRGELVTDPLTGLIQIKLARGDYDSEDLLELNASNTRNFKQTGKSYGKSLNQVEVNYRAFSPSYTQRVEGEPLLGNPSSGGNEILYVGLASHPVENVVIYVEQSGGPIVILTEEVHYTLISDRGLIALHREELEAVYDPDAGDELYIDYTPTPIFSGFIDDSVIALNSAHHQITGRLQSRSYDYPMITNVVQAQEMADSLLDLENADLDLFEWEMNRDGAHLTRVDVVKVTDSRYNLLDTPVRITDISYGTPKEPWITCRGTKDVYGERLTNTPIGSNPNTPPVQRAEAPAMSIGCGIGGEEAARIDLFPTSALLTVEVYEADDGIGTNGFLVATIAAGTDPMFYDGSPDKFYAARQIADWLDPGPLTAYINCPLTEDPPVDPSCTVPSYTYEVHELDGVILLFITDPQNRVQGVQWRSRSGVEQWSVWQIGELPYCFSVILSATEVSRIEWDITYIDCDGSTKHFLDGYDFIPSIPEPEPPSVPQPLFAMDQEVILHSSGPTPIGVDQVSVEAVPLTPWKSAQVKTPFVQAKSCYLTASVFKSDLPAGAVLILKAEVPGEPGNFQPLDGVDGPRLAMDLASLLAGDEEAANAGVLPATVEGLPVEIADEIVGSRLHIRADLEGGDGSSLTEFIPTRVSAWFSTRSVNNTPTEPPETEDPAPEDPGSCDTANPINMDSGVEEDEGGSATEWVHTTTTSQLTISGAASGHSRNRYTITGLTPDEKHTFYVTINTHGKAGVDAFLEVVGGTSAQAGGTSIELEAYGYADGSGEIEVLVGVNNLSGAGGGGTVSFGGDYDTHAEVEADGWTWSPATGGASVVVTRSESTTIKDVGASSLRMLLTHPAWTSGEASYQKVFPPGSFPPGRAVSAKIRHYIAARPWYANPIFYCGETSQGHNYSIGKGSYDVWQDLEVVGGQVPADGSLHVRFGIRTGAAVSETIDYYWDGPILVTIAGVGAIEIDFSDLGFCIGSGKGDDSTGVGGDPDNPGNEPVPEPPPGGWPDPPVPLLKTFGAWDIPVAGLGPLNATMKKASVNNTVDLLRECEENDTFVFLIPGSTDLWLTNGTWDESKYKAIVQSLYNDSATRSHLENASVGTSPYTKPRCAWQLIDEPYHPDRYGSPIAFASIERVAIFTKNLFPNMEVMLRVDPTKEWYVRKMVGVDSMWAEYLLRRGPIDSWISSRLAASESLDQPVYFGLHFAGFESAGFTRYMTAAEIRHYGTDKMAQFANRVRGFGGWKYTTAWWSMSGVPQAMIEYRDEVARNQ